MSWLLKLLRYREREFRGKDFSVRVEYLHRELVTVIYMRGGQCLNLTGELVGPKWNVINTPLPRELDDAQVPQIVHDLEEALLALRYGYEIWRKTGDVIVPEQERQAALAELNGMGYDIDVMPDGAIRQTPRAGVSRPSVELARMQGPRMMSLIQSVRGKRARIEMLAKSSEF